MSSLYDYFEMSKTRTKTNSINNNRKPFVRYCGNCLENQTKKEKMTSRIYIINYNGNTTTKRQKKKAFLVVLRIGGRFTV